MTDEDIRKGLRELFKSPTQVIPATVKTVDEAKYTCDVEFLTGQKLSGVRLKASIDDDTDGFILIPKADTKVLVALIGNDSDTAYVTLIDKIKKIIFIASGNYIKFDTDAFDVKIGSSHIMADKDGNIEFNDGSLGGLVKVDALVSKINALENLVNNILTTLKGITITLAPSGAIPFAPIFAASDLIAQVTMANDLANDKIKQ